MRKWTIASATKSTGLARLECSGFSCEAPSGCISQSYATNPVLSNQVGPSLSRRGGTSVEEPGPQAYNNPFEDGCRRKISDHDHPGSARGNKGMIKFVLPFGPPVPPSLWLSTPINPPPQGSGPGTVTRNPESVGVRWSPSGSPPDAARVRD